MRSSTFFIPRLKRVGVRQFVILDDGETVPEHMVPFCAHQGDVVDMGAPAPERVVTFSHELNRWLVSVESYWAVTTPEGARMAMDSGAALLDA